MKLLIQLLICITFSGLLLYKSIDNSNNLTELRLLIPLLQREVKEIHEKNLELFYTIESFESPQRLMKLASSPEYSYLEYPLDEDVLLFDEDK